MKSIKPSIRNLAFFDALATTTQITETSNRNALERELVAAILVLRLFADWADAPAILTESPTMLVRINATIADIEDTGVRHLFGAAVSTMHHSVDEPGEAVAPLLAYAWILEERGQFALATDVLSTVADVIAPERLPMHRTVDPLLAATVHRRLGDLAIRRRDLSNADFHYSQQVAFATAAKNPTLLRNARTHMAILQEVRGNLGVAESTLTAIVEEANQAADRRAEAYARRVRGSVVQRQGRPAEALRDFYAGYTIAVDWMEREWLLNDIAACASQLGLRALAQLIFTALSKTAHNAAGKSLALVNLLEISVLDDDRVAFDEILQQLEPSSLPREQQLYMHLFAAMGTARWDGTDAGIAAYEAVADQAKTLGFHEMEARAHEAIEQLKTDAVPSTVTAPSGGAAYTPPKDADWEQLTGAIEAECHLRLSTVGTDGTDGTENDN